jgi:hypothetical protein
VQSKKQYNDQLLANLQAEVNWCNDALSKRSFGKRAALFERLEVLESAIKQHNAMAETDAEEERMEALRGECGMESRK